jgi:hypothetical protein
MLINIWKTALVSANSKYYFLDGKFFPKNKQTRLPSSHRLRKFAVSKKIREYPVSKPCTPEISTSIDGK